MASEIASGPGEPRGFALHFNSPVDESHATMGPTKPRDMRERDAQMFIDCDRRRVALRAVFCVDTSTLKA
ncbi:hypothetical protein O9K51_03390 [Purpureocillium lavendulum]|uniref:Uncharacterized protein n=1 Tax=Purpureocillium lavendulum TaxID=1247861 RepID=A0AB34G006_9HYPO|nr:hypothetical protein O9K51_03390 [Purpureocillium lavendulum]